MHLVRTMTVLKLFFRRTSESRRGKFTKGGSDNHSSSEESEFHKNMAAERRVSPDCANASNPFHVCADYCFERIAKEKTQPKKKESDSFFRVASPKAIRRMKGEAKSLPKHVVVPSNFSGHIKARTPDALSPSSVFSSKKSVGSANGELISSPRHHSEDACADQDPLLNGKHVQSFHSEPSPRNDKTVIMPAGQKKKSVTESSEESVTFFTSAKSTKQEEDLGSGERTASPVVGSMSSNISDVTLPFEDEEEEGDQSVISDSKVLVGKYYVKASNASTLQSILDQHGDIAADCPLESVAIRSYYLDCVCFVVRELQSTSFLQLTKSKVKELSAILKDVESAQIKVGWLRQRLNGIGEAMDLISHHRAMQEAKSKCDQSLESTKKELASQMEDLARKEKEIADAKVRISEMEQRLSELELESSQVNESYSAIRSKVENFQLQSMSDVIA